MSVLRNLRRPGGVIERLRKCGEDRIYRVPRVWSNGEIAKVAHLVEGSVVNVSAWTDSDKEGRSYRDYFYNARDYQITNYRSDMRGFQGQEGEIFLDLERKLPADLVDKYDCVLNHTTLEHIYDYNRALDNLCLMTRDLLIIVVPFLQPMHSLYGDYWRFSPQAIARMLEDRGLAIGRLSFNSDRYSSVYVFCVASKKPEQWRERLEFRYEFVDPKFSQLEEPFAGCNAIPRPGAIGRLLAKWAED